jgi:hypothetical protein
MLTERMQCSNSMPHCSAPRPNTDPQCQQRTELSCLHSKQLTCALQVETFFNRTSVLTHYWIGLSKIGAIFYWQGGGFAGTGVTSDASPYGKCL